MSMTTKPYREDGRLQIPGTRGRRAFFCSLGLAWALGLVAGCASSSRAPTSQQDPLFGPGTPRRATTAPGLTSSATPTEVPPPPIPGETRSPAALASGKIPVFDSNRDLRIGGQDESARGWRGTEGVLTAGVKLNGPEPDPTVPAAVVLPAGAGGTAPAIPSTGFAPATPPAAPSPGLTQDQLLGRMKSLGVQWQRLESTTDTAGWRFICSLPSPTNPNASRTYEARATEPLAAMQAVLEQIERERGTLPPR